MELTSEHKGPVLMISVSGRIDGVNAREFESSMSDIITSDDKAVVLNLAGLSYISSAGLRSILITAKNLSTNNAKFSLCAIPSNIMEIVKVAGFDRIIDIKDDQDSAIAAFS